MEFNATFFVSIVSFLVFVWGMNRLFYRPLTEIVQKRETILEQNYSEAKTFNDDADAILKERDEKLSDVAAKSREKISSKIEKSNANAKALALEAASNSANAIKRRKEELSQEKNEAVSALNSQVKNLAEQISSKVLGFDVKIEDSSQFDEVKL